MTASDAMEIAPTDIRNGILFVRGYGIRIRVNGGHLLVEDGIAKDRRVIRIPKVAP